MKRALLVLLVVLAGCPGEDKYTVEKLQDPATCMACHPKHYTQWSGSMHAYASDDPVFVAMNKRGQRDTGGALGDFCIKCHAPMAVQLGVATGANFDPATLPPEAKGITCYFCHNVKSIVDDHNNGLVLAMDQTMRGGAKKPVDSPAHNSAYDPNMASYTNKSVMCGSCHDVTTPTAMVHLERTYAEWQTTIFALNDPTALLPQTCSRCHMTPTKDVIATGTGLHVGARDDGFHDHTMAAMDQALTPFPELDAQRMEVEKILKPAVGIVAPRPLGADSTYGGICLDPPGDLGVRIDSLGVGHHFPSGAGQDRRVWLQVIAYDANNNEVFSSGKVPANQDPEEINDPYINCSMPGTNRCSAFWDKTYTADNMQAHFFWDVARYDTNLIRPPITRETSSPAYDHSSKVVFTILPSVFSQIDRIEAKIYARPLPFGAVDSLISSGDLDPAIRTKLEQPEATLLVVSSTWLKSTAGTDLAINTNCNPF